MNSARIVITDYTLRPPQVLPQSVENHNVIVTARSEHIFT